jgi:hypothetical protein
MSQITETNPIRASLMAAACICIEYQTGEWTSVGIVPCEETFRNVEAFTSSADAVEVMSPDHAAYLLLLVRETIH